jgi:hypothetical protein
MTQPAETVGYEAARHLQAILYHAGWCLPEDLSIIVLSDTAWIDQSLIRKYRLESAVPVLAKTSVWSALGVQHHRSAARLCDPGVIRHEPTGLAKIVVRLANAAPEQLRPQQPHGIIPA